jgi:ferredoxin-NADP reductase
LQVRVGGRFVYPPPYLSERETLDIKRIVFVAGGVGINPVMSMLEHLDLESHLDPARVRSLRLLYGTRARPVEAILFYERIARILGKYLKCEPAVAGADHDYRATMYLTGGTKGTLDEVSRHKMLESDQIEHKYRRVNHADLIEALGPVAERKGTVAYVCGPPRMTDEFVENLSRADGMDPRCVLCEKWW